MLGEAWTGMRGRNSIFDVRLKALAGTTAPLPVQHQKGNVTRKNPASLVISEGEKGFPF